MSTTSPRPEKLIKPFDKETTKWERWIARLEIAFKFYKTSNDDQVHGLLVHLGPSAFDSLADFLNGADPTTLTYAQLKAKLEDLFAPKKLEIAENFKFYNRRQMQGEDIQTFANALNHLSAQCNFGSFKEKALLNQFVVGVNDVRIQRSLLETKNLDYDKALQAATALELTNKEASTLLPNKSNTINVLHASKNVVPKSAKNNLKFNKPHKPQKGFSNV